MRRKGELSAARIDRDWPHQIMLPYDQVNGQHHKDIHAFCADLSLCPRGHSIMRDDQWHRVFCFVVKADAEKFQAQFGGEWFDPAQRSKRRSWMKIKAPKPRLY